MEEAAATVAAPVPDVGLVVGGYVCLPAVGPLVGAVVIGTVSLCHGRDGSDGHCHSRCRRE